MADNRSTSFKSDERTLKNLRPLVNIEYVRVNKIVDEFDNEELDDATDKWFVLDKHEIPCWEEMTFLHGTVIVTDCCGDELLYHQCPADGEVADEYLSVEGPSRAISSHDMFIICVNLWARVWVRVPGTEKDEDGDAEIYEHQIHKEIASGEIIWDPRTRDQFPYEQLVQEDVLGKRGSVTVGYSVIREALSATVKVVMMTESIPLFYGTIKADRLLGGSSTTTRMLFKTSRDQRMRRQPLLVRPTFALAVDSYITIAVDLWNYEGELSPGSQIVMGSVQFSPIFGEQMKSIGQVQVYITCE